MEVKKRKIEEKVVAKCVEEKDVGILDYVNATSPGFSGLIKQRYSDFQVNEIGLDGAVLHLKEVELAPEPEPEPEPKPEPEVVPESGEKDEPQETAQTRRLAELVSPEFVDQCRAILADSEAPKPRTPTLADKAVRSEIHTLIREGFGGQLESRTDDSRIVVLKLTRKSRKTGRERNGSTRGGRAPQAEYLYFTLYKENKETMEAITTIARFLHVPPKLFTFAGTKDRRAATTQRVCWRRGSAQRLAGLNGAFKSGNIRLGDFTPFAKPLHLGDLAGNQFGIVIRKCQPGESEAVEQSLRSLRDNGFINYFGLQRFGTFSVSSHTTGKSILKGDYDAAVDGLLNPQDVTIEDSREAREVWHQTKDAAKALELMPRRCVAETALLGALKDSPSAINAILQIPHALKTMYVHAYQSYVWNRAASERISRGQRVLVGDLVLRGEYTERGIEEAHEIGTEEEASKYTMFDVVLPMPGNDIKYPDNMLSFYEALMAHDGIDCHSMRHKIKEFSVFGSYRYVLAKPRFVEWETRWYTEDTATILYTDRERLEHNGEKLAPEGEGQLAVVVKMGLSTSQYATMALREAMKKETSRNGEIYFG